MGPSPSPSPSPPRRAERSPDFRAWTRSLDPERRAKVEAAIRRIVGGGPTLGRPLVDVIHSSPRANLKEARIDRGTRVLFAFDSNRNPVMLVGGDKTGEWNRWYKRNIDRALRLWDDHERGNGREPPSCLSRRTGPRTPRPRPPSSMGL